MLLKAIPILSDQGTELSKVGVDPILHSLYLNSKVGCVDSCNANGI